MLAIGAGVVIALATVALAAVLVVEGPDEHGSLLDGATTQDVFRTEQPADNNASSNESNLPAARPHPRGLPRVSGRRLRK